MSRYVRTEGNLSSPLDDELMLLADDGTYYSLGRTGAHIWERLATPQEETALVADLAETFAVEASIAAADVRRFLDELQAAGLIRPA